MAVKKKKLKKTDQLLAVMNRNGFYKDSQHMMIVLIGLELVIIAALVVAIMTSLGLYQTQYRYFATTNDGKIIEHTPLYQDKMDDSTVNADAIVTNWIATTMRKVFTFGFHDYKQVFSRSSRFFTPDGYQNYLEQVNNKFLTTSFVADDKVLVSTVVRAPKIIAKGVVNGVYTWQIVLTIRFELQGGNEPTLTDDLTFKVDVVRVPALRNSDGLGISRFLPYNETTGRGRN